ncbi:MAG: M1 family metallopeptidase [Lachnospiraceae bacterium]|nr:M1 family metallopeptidase [Lachnospiraceae bacterium]
MHEIKRGIALISVCLVSLFTAACGTKDEIKCPEANRMALVNETGGTDSGSDREVPTPAPTPIPTEEPWQEEGREIKLPEEERYRYDMDIVLDISEKTLHGHVVFDFFNDTNETWDKLCMRDYPSLFTDPEAAGYEEGKDIHGALTEFSALTDGRDGSEISFERDEDVSVIWLTLKEPLAPGEKMTLTCDYTASVPNIGDRFGYLNGIYCMTDFYPILAEYDRDGWSHEPFGECNECCYSEVADYDVRITVPNDFDVASTGVATARRNNGATVTFAFRADCVRNFMFAASDAFVRKTETFDDVKVNLLYVKEYDAMKYMSGAVEAAMKAAEDSLAAFGTALGRYPYGELDIVITPLRTDGIGYPNIVVITDEVFRPFALQETEQTATEVSYGMLEESIAHEIAHQWFLGVVGTDSGKQPWQEESLTAYLELVFAEYRGKTEWASGRYGISQADLRDPEVTALYAQNEFLPINKTPAEYPDMTKCSISTYNMGRMVFMQMEEILGQKELYSVLREYVRRNTFRNAYPEDFFTVLYEFAGTDNAELNALLENCFDLSRLR